MQKGYVDDSIYTGRLRKCLSKDHLKMMVNAFNMSPLGYCNSVYCGLPKREIDKLRCVPCGAARSASGTKTSDHITPVMKDLHWLNIGACTNFKILLLTFEILNDLAPSYLSSLLVKYHTSLRSSNLLPFVSLRRKANQVTIHSQPSELCCEHNTIFDFISFTLI